MKSANDFLSEVAVFISPSSAGQVWELKNLKAAEKAIVALPFYGAKGSAYNWCPVQQPDGPVRPNYGYAAGRSNPKDRIKPRILVIFG